MNIIKVIIVQELCSNESNIMYKEIKSLRTMTNLKLL